MENGVYKYVFNNEVIYIGKSVSSFSARISAHKSETKFKPYIKKGCDIYVCELPNPTETELIEKALINRYKPILNGIDNYAGFSYLIKVEELNWEKYDNYLIRKEKLLKGSSKGRPIQDASRGRKREYCKTINIAVPKEVLEELNELAMKARGVTLTEYVNLLIVHDLEKNRDKYKHALDYIRKQAEFDL